MNTCRFSQICPALVLLLLGVLALGRPTARAEDAAPMITQAKNFLQDERYLDALASAKDAVRADPENYQAHFYVGMAHLALEQFDAAAEAASRALALAPEAGKPGVTKLVETIKTRRQGAGAAQQAAAALADGMAGKAARLYEQAWNAAQDNPELGLKAADLYVHKLDQPVDAARVLRQVQRIASGDALARAEATIKEIEAPLYETAAREVNTASRLADPAEQERHLKKAEDAYPDFMAIYTIRVILTAQRDSVEALQAAITTVARHKIPSMQNFVSVLPNFARWMANPAMSEFLTDMIGAKQVAQLQDYAANGMNPAEGKPHVIFFLDLKLMPIPAGSFAMGGTNQYARETPKLNVTISHNFWLGEHEVTKAQWESVRRGYFSSIHFDGEDLPAEGMTWKECQEFCSNLTEIEKQAGRLPKGYVYRLPTEAEWEYACRAGTTGDYGGTGVLDSMGWYEKNSGGKTHPVGQKQPNAWGLYDMHGNVFEWCADWRGDYKAGDVTDPTGPSTGTTRVERGGSYDTDAYDCSSTYRNYIAEPDKRYTGLGFRLVLGPAQ